jgi:hypothetical protein
MAVLVHQALPLLVADKLTRCRSWPGLAKRLEAWQQQGLPVDVMLESLPLWGIKLHPRPASYATRLMRKSVDQHLADVTFAAYAHEAMTAGYGAGPSTPGPGRTDTGSDQVSSDAEPERHERETAPEHLTSAEDAGGDEEMAAEECTSATEERGEAITAAGRDELTCTPDGHDCSRCAGVHVGV